MSLRLPRASRPRLGLAAATLLLAAGAVGCGGDDDSETTSTSASAPTAASTASGPATTTAGGGGGGNAGQAPGQDEAAIRAAIKRAPAAIAAAKTARIEIELTNAGIESTGSGTVELTTERYAMKQQVGGGAGVQLDNYGEKGRVYIRTGGQGWKVTENPVEGNDPLAQVRQLEKAKILEVRETAEFDGATCRWFDAEVKLTDVLGNIDDPAAEALIEGAPAGAAIPVSSCVDDTGLTYAVDQEFEPSEVFGGAAANIPGKSVTKVRLSDYGTAPAPERPAGIDDAQPLGTGGLDTPSAG